MSQKLNDCKKNKNSVKNHSSQTKASPTFIAFLGRSHALKYMYRKCTAHYEFLYAH